MKRKTAIQEKLTKISSRKLWCDFEPEDIYHLWAEQNLIDNELFGRRYMGEFEKALKIANVFLCHSSVDKGMVRMLHDDLKRLGVRPWLDENEIEVGDSLVAKISMGLQESKFLIICLSQSSIKSKWAKKEWQSFLARQMSNPNVFVLPALFEECEIPAIIYDIKFADFREDYNKGFREIYRALKANQY